MSTTWSAIEDALRARVEALAGMPVIWAQQKAPRPALPYAQLTYTTRARVGGTHEQRAEGAGVYSQLAHERVVIQVDIFTRMPTTGESAGWLAESCARGLTLRSSLDSLAAAGARVVQIGAVRDLSALGETEQEDRAGFDLTLAYAVAAPQSLSWIETVPITEP